MTESELLFTELLNYSRDELYLFNKRQLSQRQTRFLANALRRRFQGEPIQYILGKTEFMGMEFSLTPDVFIPRPETEILVETVIKLVTPQAPGARRYDIMDIGTGSGNIAISLAKLLPNAKITATDISERALKVAKKNALLNNVEINFLQSDLFSNYGLRTTDYGLIISNPPYIPTAEINNLELELGYEPRLALDGGRDGLDFYRRIIPEIPAYLKKRGFLILEIGFNQYLAIKELFNSVKEFKIIEVAKDYNNIERVIIARYG